MNYKKIIEKYFDKNPSAKSIYLIHVTLVTKKALEIAHKLNLDNEALKFIEEASMLHDIGCCNVDFPEMHCDGKLPYLCHMTEGHSILESEGLPKHARVASTHTGVGIYANEIKENNLPLEEKDYLAESIEEKIISYADLFFSKNPDSLFTEKTPEQIRKSLEKFGERHLRQFDNWHNQFNPK